MMSRLKNLSFQSKLGVMVLGTMLLALLVTASAVYYLERLEGEQNLSQDMQGLARILATNSQASLLFDDAVSAEETLASLRTVSHVVYAVLNKPDQPNFAEYRSEAFDVRLLDLVVRLGIADHSSLSTKGYFIVRSDINVDNEL